MLIKETKLQQEVKLKIEYDYDFTCYTVKGIAFGFSLSIQFADNMEELKNIVSDMTSSMLGYQLVNDIELENLINKVISSEVFMPLPKKEDLTEISFSRGKPKLIEVSLSSKEEYEKYNQVDNHWLNLQHNKYSDWLLNGDEPIDVWNPVSAHELKFRTHKASHKKLSKNRKAERHFKSSIQKQQTIIESEE